MKSIYNADQRFVERVIKGSANIDLMRKEIKNFVGIILGFIPTSNVSNGMILCPVGGGWEVVVRPNIVQRANTGVDYEGSKVSIRYVRQQDEKTLVCFECTRHLSTGNTFSEIQLEWVKVIHGSLAVLLKAVTDYYESSELTRHMQLLVDAT